jgi:hypothetical protein
LAVEERQMSLKKKFLILFLILPLPVSPLTAAKQIPFILGVGGGGPDQLSLEDYYMSGNIIRESRVPVRSFTYI